MPVSNLWIKCAYVTASRGNVLKVAARTFPSLTSSFGLPYP